MKFMKFFLPNPFFFLIRRWLDFSLHSRSKKQKINKFNAFSLLPKVPVSDLFMFLCCFHKCRQSKLPAIKWYEKLSCGLFWGVQMQHLWSMSSTSVLQCEPGDFSIFQQCRTQFALPLHFFCALLLECGTFACMQFVPCLSLSVFMCCCFSDS